MAWFVCAVLDTQLVPLGESWNVLARGFIDSEGRFTGLTENKAALEHREQLQRDAVEHQRLTALQAKNEKNQKAMEIRTRFTSDVGLPMESISFQDLVANPFVHKGKAVSFVANFMQMISATTGRFGYGDGLLVVSDIPSGLLRRSERVVVAGQVTPPKSGELGPPTVFLRYLALYKCEDYSCEDFLGAK